MNPLVTDLRSGFDELRETHISWVFLGVERVLKVKKPVAFGFLDFRTVDARKAACEAELELNRRLAPDVYLRLVPIRCDESGTHRADGAGQLRDWGVEMLRLRDDDAADQRLASGRLTREDVVSIGTRLARFHADVRADDHTARFGSVETIERNVRENFDQTRHSAPMHLSPAQVAELERYQLGFIETHADTLAERVARGYVRDGHGDLRLEHVYVADDGVIQVIDCIEFNERFRFADVCADLAFLSMDLAWHGRVDLAELLLATYARVANDFDLYLLIDFYESYRAFVRAKVESFVEFDLSQPSTTRERAAAQARKHYLLALACARPPLQPPFLCAVGGLIASGKSTLSERIALEASVPVVDADRTRKHLAHVDPTQPLAPAAGAAFDGAYSQEATDRVYTELLARADAVLSSGRPVVIDASFRERSWREAVRALALRHGVPFRFIECRPPLDACRARLHAREQRPNVSDARADLLDTFVAKYEAVTEIDPSEHIVVDTSGALAENAERVIAALQSACDRPNATGGTHTPGTP